MKYLVPLARANKDACIARAAELGRHRLSTRQIGAVYAAWMAGDEAERAQLLDDPLLFLRALAAAKRATPQRELSVDRLSLRLARRAPFIGRQALRILLDVVELLERGVLHVANDRLHRARDVQAQWRQPGRVPRRRAALDRARPARADAGGVGAEPSVVAFAALVAGRFNYERFEEHAELARALTA
jgi:hypothetical protein